MTFEATTVKEDKTIELSIKLATYKAKSGVSYRKMAEEIGISYNMLVKLTGKASRRASLDTLSKVATYLESKGE